MAVEIQEQKQARPRISFAQFRELNVLVALLLLWIFFYWRSPEVFAKPANLAVIMRFIATFGMLAIGEVLIIITGGIDLSVGSLTALTGVIVATLILKGVAGLPPLGILPSILIVLAIGAAFGVSHGLFVTKLKIPAFISPWEPGWWRAAWPVSSPAAIRSCSHRNRRFSSLGRERYSRVRSRS